MTVDVAFTPADVRPTQVAVVVDVLRASTTIVAALDAGYQRVLCTASVDGAKALEGPGRLLAGERECKPVEGFDFGNSPRTLGAARGEELVLCTTNGTPAILTAVAIADEVLVGCLANLGAVVGSIEPGTDVSVVCAGTGGRFALEDAYVAGRIVEQLEGERTDGARAAELIAGSYDQPLVPLTDNSNAAVLRETGQAEDIAYCAQESISATVPRITAATREMATVAMRSGQVDVDKSMAMDNA